MFDIGFSELLVIAVVALVVLGPERLPKAARFAGLWVRRARAQWYSVKSELERELASDELKRSLHDSQAVMREIDASVRAADADARREFDAMRNASKAMTATAAAPVVAPPAVTPSDRRDAPGYEREPDADADPDPDPDDARDDHTRHA
jgi:sec-independent protein translocase protein TatB